MKEQSILLTIRRQLSTLGYSESIIDSQTDVIENFANQLISSADILHTALFAKESITELDATRRPEYKYYMYINNPSACTWLDEEYLNSPEWAESYRNSIRGFIFDTFESECDWEMALEARDLNTLHAIYGEVYEFCKTNPVPSEVESFLQNTPKLLAARNWDELRYNGIVDAYCDQDTAEYIRVTI